MFSAKGMPMIAYPAERNARKRAVFAALAQVAGGARAFPVGPLSWRNFPETDARVDQALSRAKRPHRGVMRRLKRLLLRLKYNGARRWFMVNPHVVAVAWNGLGGARQAFLMGAKDAGAAVLFAELAPLPGKITLDPAGVNAESGVPQQADFYQDWAKAQDTSDWKTAGQGLTARPSRRSDVGQSTGQLPDTPFLFCPLQVPGDSQVQLFAGWVGGMDGFLAALDQAARALPQGWHLRIKEHPSARKPLRPQIEAFGNPNIIIDNDSDSFAQIAASRGVVTLNSSMGLQAFFHDKPVIALGRAFWAIPGLAEAPQHQSSLNAAFARAENLSFDANLRAAFVHWLDCAYYPDFAPDPLKFDHAAFAAKIQAAKALSPAPPLR
jgi:capsular polysaccharide export protein